MTLPPDNLELALPRVAEAIPDRIDLHDPTTVYALTVLLLSCRRALRGGGPIRRVGPESALRALAAALGGVVLREGLDEHGQDVYCWLCDDAAVRRLVWSARVDPDVTRAIFANVPTPLRALILLAAWDTRGTRWLAAPGLPVVAVGGPAGVVVPLREIAGALGFSEGTMASRNRSGSPDELRLGGRGQVVGLQRLVMETSLWYPAAWRVRLREPRARLRLLVRTADRTRSLPYPPPSLERVALGQTVIQADAGPDVRLVAEAFGLLDGTRLLSRAERVWAAVVILGLAGLEPGQPWSGAESAWRTRAEIVEWASEHAGLLIMQTRFSSLVRQLEAIGLTERDDTRRRYRVSDEVVAVLTRSGSARPTADRLSHRLARALRQRPRQQWLELPTTVTVGVNEVRRLPRVGQSEILALALSHTDLVWPQGGQVIWLDEGRSEVLKDADALTRIGLGSRLGHEGSRPDLILLTRDAGGRALLVVAEACASRGAVTRTRAQELRSFLSRLRSGVRVQLVTLVLREEHLAPWRYDLADESWVWVGERLTTERPVLIPALSLREAIR